MASADLITAERTIPALPQVIFDVISNPSQHPDLDESGTVRARGRFGKLALGSKFGMSMRLGVPFGTENTVVEFDEPSRIAWQPGHWADAAFRRPGLALRTRTGRRRHSRAEAWDITRESPLTKPIVRMAASTTAKNMTAALERLEKILSTS